MEQHERTTGGGRGARIAWYAGLVWLAAFALVALLRDDEASSAPAVVALVVWDSIDLERLGAYGYEHGATPALDALAAEALVYEEHVPCVDSTVASTASLLTGLRPRHHGLGRISPFGRRRLPDSIPSLAERFRDAGWTTIAAVSLPHLDGAASGLARGFDVYEGPPAEPVRAVRACEETLASIRKPLELAITRGERVFVFVHLADVRAPELARAAGAGRFLPRVAASYAAKDPALAAELTRAAGDPGALEELVEKYARRRGDPLRAELDSAFYDAAVARMDAALAQLLALVGQGGRRACVAVTGGRAGGALFGGSDDPAQPDRRLRAPLVLRLPVAGYDGRSRVPTQDLDLAPTLASLARLAPFEHSDGLDLVRPLFAGSPPARELPPLVERGDFALRAAVGERWLLASDREHEERPLERAADGDAAEAVPDGTFAQLRATLAAIPGLGHCRVTSIVAESDEPVSEPRRARGEGRGALELVLSHAEQPTGALEEHVWIGGRTLRELDLPLFQSGAEPWPVDADGNPAPAAARLVELKGGWTAVTVGEPSDGPARVVLEWSPARPELGLDLVRAGEGARVEPHPRRAGAVVVSGPAPLELEVRRRPSGRFALACFLPETGRVPAHRIRVETGDERGSLCFVGRAEPELFVSPGAWDDPELYTPAPAELEAGVVVELLDPPPAGPPDPPRSERELLLRKQLSTTD